MPVQSDLDELVRSLVDESQGGFWHRWRAVRRLARLATEDGRVRSLNATEARTVVEGLATGLEGVHGGVATDCRRVLAQLTAPALIEAVCDVLLERDLPRLRALAVHAGYTPHDPIRRAAYLFVVGRLQFYEDADPQGQLLAQFYVAAPIPLRDRLLGLARSRGGPQEGQLIAARLRQVGVGTLSAAEVDATLAVISQPAWYALHDPEGELLVQFYAAVAPAVRTRLWGLARLEEDQRWGRLVAVLQRERGWTEMSDAELEAAVVILCQAQRWEAVWSIVLEGRVPWSWREAQTLIEAGWQPRDRRAATCWREVEEAVRQVDDPTTVVGVIGRQVAMLRGHRREVEALVMSPDGRLLGSGSEEGNIQLRTLPEGQELALLGGHKGWILALAASPDGQLLASGGQDGTIRLWRLPQGQGKAVLRGHTDWVRALAVSPDGKLLASGGDDRTVRLWGLPLGVERAVLHGHPDVVWALAVSPDGQLLASGGKEGAIRLWMLPQGVERAVLHGHTGEVRALVVSLDGQLLVSGGQDGTIRLWRLPQGQEHAVLHGHTGAVRALAVSPNGQLLASGSADRTIRLWTLPGGQAQAVWQGHQRGVRALAMGPTCQLLAAGCGDGTIRLWELWDMSPMLQVPLGHMGRTEYERVRLGTVEASLSSEQQVVARYVAAMLRYRLGEDRP